MPGASIPPNEVPRLAALRGLGVLDTPPSACLNRIMAVARRVCGVPSGAVSLVDEKRQWFAARCGLSVSETPRDQAFCGYAILGDGPLIVPDATRDPRFSDNPLVIDGIVRAYAGAPIVLWNGHRIGTVCVIDRVPRDFTSEQIDTLIDLAAITARKLELRSHSDMLDRAHARADAASRAKSEFLSGVTHAVRTPLTTISGYAELLAGEDVTGAQLGDFAGMILGAVSELVALVDDLAVLADAEGGGVNAIERVADLRALLREPVREHLAVAVSRDLRIEVEIDSELPERALVSQQFGHVLSRVVKHALEQTRQGAVRIEAGYDRRTGKRAGRSGGGGGPASIGPGKVGEASGRRTLRVVVSDTGSGLSSDQLAALDVRSPCAPCGVAAGPIMGLPLAARLIAALGGELTVTSASGEGSRYAMSLPIQPLCGVPASDAGGGSGVCWNAPREAGDAHGNVRAAA